MDRKFKASYGKWFMTPVRRAIKRYNMMSPGDRIAVGVSGGKDSLSLLFIMWILKKYFKWDFELLAVYVDMGWGVDPSPLENFCQELGVPFHREPTSIKEVVFEYRQEANPCALCSHLRRGALNGAAKSLGCNKVALGHHLDDLLETFLLNWFHNGKFSTFLPVTYLSRIDLTVIRPLIYLPEASLTQLARSEKFPLLPNPCPVAGKTQRHRIKEVVAYLEKHYPFIRQRYLTALEGASWFCGCRQ